jgi:hypothetical protein
LIVTLSGCLLGKSTLIVGLPFVAMRRDTILPSFQMSYVTCEPQH